VLAAGERQPAELVETPGDGVRVVDRAGHRQAFGQRIAGRVQVAGHQGRRAEVDQAGGGTTAVAQPAGDGQRRIGQFGGPAGVAAHPCGEAEMVAAARLAGGIAGGAPQRQALRAEPVRVGVPSLLAGDAAERLQRRRGPGRVTLGPQQRQRLLQVVGRHVVPALQQRQRAGAGARLRHGARRSDPAGKRPVEPIQALRVMAAQRPPAAQRCGQPQRCGRAVVQRPVQRRPQVVPVGLQPAHPLRLVRAGEPGLRALGQLDAQLRVPPAHRVGLAGLVQPVLGVPADGLQQPVPAVAVLPAQLDQRLLGQPGQQRQHVAGGEVAGCPAVGRGRVARGQVARGPAVGRGRVARGQVARGRVARGQVAGTHAPAAGLAAAGADRLGLVHAEAAGERGEPAEQHLLARRQQVVAPVHGRPQGALPAGAAPPGAGEQPQRVVQPDGDPVHRHRRDPPGGELDRQRQPVQARADRRHGGRVLLGEGERRVDRGGPLDEQPDRRELGQRVERRRRGRVGHRQQRHRPAPLAGQAENLPAGHQDVQVRAAGQERLHQVGKGCHDVLAVVQDEQHPLAAQVVQQRAGERGVRHFPHADRGGRPGSA